MWKWRFDRVTILHMPQQLSYGNSPHFLPDWIIRMNILAKLIFVSVYEWIKRLLNGAHLQITR